MTDLLHAALIRGGLDAAHHHLRRGDTAAVLRTLQAVEDSLIWCGYACHQCGHGCGETHHVVNNFTAPRLQHRICSDQCLTKWREGLSGTARGIDERPAA